MAIQVRNSSYRELIGNGLTYRVPPFQRDYSWSEEHWEELWADLLGTIDGEERSHYLGYLVLQSRDDKQLDVIDGQQRLTTLALLVLAALKVLKSLTEAGTDVDANNRRAEELRRIFLGALDPVSLTTKSKLTLNRHSDFYFQTYLLPLAKLPVRNRNQSEHALRRAFQWFHEKVGKRARDRGADTGAEVARLIEHAGDRLFFTVINVTDELNAYRVFETLNARGVKLSSTDLLKNHLFSVLSRDAAHAEADLEAVELRWEDVVNRLGSEDFPEFLRAHWLSTGRGFVRHATLFKEVRQAVTSRQEVFELIRALDEDVEIYLSLTEPGRTSFAPKVREHAEELRRYGVKQPIPLLMAAHRALDENQFEQVLRACTVVAFRYNVIGGLSPGDQEPVFWSIAQALARGEITSAAQVIERFRPVYVGDETFKATFAERAFSSRKDKLTRFMLARLEQQSGGADIDFDSATLSIEHVFPREPEPQWPEFQDRDELVERIGNLTLLRKSSNRALGNATYDAKRRVYESSEFSLTRELAEENDVWTPERVEARSRKLATLAGARWRLDQLS